MRGYQVTVEGSTIGIRLPKLAAKDMSHRGDCSADVAVYVDKLRGKLGAIPADMVRDLLAGYGAWDDLELQDTEQNLHRLLWIAAGNVIEEDSCWVWLDAS